MSPYSFISISSQQVICAISGGGGSLQICNSAYIRILLLMQKYGAGKVTAIYMHVEMQLSRLGFLQENRGVDFNQRTVTTHSYSLQ